MSWNVLVTRRFPGAGLEALRDGGCEIDLNPHDRFMTREELLGGMVGKHGLLAMLADRIDAPVMDAGAPTLVGIANYAVGFDNIDVLAATSRGLPVSNTPGVLTEATADVAWTLLLAAARRVIEGDGLARAGRWEGWAPLQLLGRDLAGATLAVVGAGRIGTAVARRAVGFGMTILYVEPETREELERTTGARRVTLEEALASADFVSLHVPLNEETRHLIGPAELGRMKPTAILVNTSRGPVLDEAALVAALRERRIFAAGLDVYEEEPKIPEALRGLDNVVLLPHLGSATVETRDRMAVMAARNLVAMLRGECPPDLVNPGALEAR